MGEAESKWGTIDSGVPQGLILGPLIFTIMVNDLHNVVSKCKIMFYADVAVLIYSSPNPEEIEKNNNFEFRTERCTRMGQSK